MHLDIGSTACTTAKNVPVLNIVCCGVCSSYVPIPDLQVLALDGFSRRNVFIMAISLAIGAGLNIVPDWGSNSLWNLGPDASSGVTTLRYACVQSLTFIALHCLSAFVNYAFARLTFRCLA